MRVAAGGALLFHGVAALTAGLAPASVAFHIVCAAMGVLLVVGLWTPIVGALAAIDAALHGFFNPADAGFYVLLATLAAALALLGPGAWSVDARLFGWRRVEIRERQRTRKEARATPLMRVSRAHLPVGAAHSSVVVQNTDRAVNPHQQRLARECQPAR